MGVAKWLPPLHALFPLVAPGSTVKSFIVERKELGLEAQDAPLGGDLDLADEPTHVGRDALLPHERRLVFCTFVLATAFVGSSDSILIATSP